MKKLLVFFVVFALLTTLPEVAAVNLSEGQGPKICGGILGICAVVEDGTFIIDDTTDNTRINVVPVIIDDISVSPYKRYPYRSNSKIALTMPITRMHIPPASEKMVEYRICIAADSNLQEIANAMQFGVEIFVNKDPFLISGFLSAKTEQKNAIDLDYISFFPDHATYMSSGWKDVGAIAGGVTPVKVVFSAWATKPVAGEFRAIIDVRFTRITIPELATTV